MNQYLFLGHQYLVNSMIIHLYDPNETLLNLSGDLFSKKMRTELTLEPTTGAVEKIETELIKK